MNAWMESRALISLLVIWDELAEICRPIVYRFWSSRAFNMNFNLNHSENPIRWQTLKASCVNPLALSDFLPKNHFACECISNRKRFDFNLRSYPPATSTREWIISLGESEVSSWLCHFNCIIIVTYSIVFFGQCNGTTFIVRIRFFTPINDPVFVASLGASSFLSL